MTALNNFQYAVKPPVNRLVRRAGMGTGMVGVFPHNGMAHLLPAASGMFPPFAMTAGAWTVDQQGAAMKYNGTTSKAVQPSAATLQLERTQGWSVSLWFMGTANGASSQLVGCLNASGTTFQGWELAASAIGASGLFQFILCNTITTNWILATTAAGTVLLNTLYHGVVTYNGNSAFSGVKLYLNGLNMALTNGADNLSASTVSPAVVQMGQRNSGSVPLTGNISNLAIFPNRVLTPMEVKRLYYTERTALLAPVMVRRWIKAAAAAGGVFPWWYYQHVAGFGGSG